MLQIYLFDWLCEDLEQNTTIQSILKSQHWICCQIQAQPVWPPFAQRSDRFCVKASREDVFGQVEKGMIQLEAYHWPRRFQFEWSTKANDSGQGISLTCTIVPERFHGMDTLRQMLRFKRVIRVKRIIQVEAYDPGRHNGWFFEPLELRKIELGRMIRVYRHFSRKVVKWLVLMEGLYKWTMGVQDSTFVTSKLWLAYWEVQGQSRASSWDFWECERVH